MSFPAFFTSVQFLSDLLKDGFLTLDRNACPQRLVAIFAPKVVETERWPLVLCLQRHCRNLGLRGTPTLLSADPTPQPLLNNDHEAWYPSDRRPLPPEGCL